MPDKFLTDLKKELDGKIAVLERRCAEQVEQQKSNPAFEATVDRLRRAWDDKGEPALAACYSLQKELGPFLQRASELDWEGLKRDGLNGERLQAARSNVESTSLLLVSTIRQLSAIPGRIDALTPAVEAPHLIGCKESDYISFEMRVVLDAPNEIRERCKTLSYQLEEIEKRRRNSTNVPKVGA